MTRGNQREIDRARAAARKGAQAKKQTGNVQQVRIVILGNMSDVTAFL